MPSHTETPDPTVDPWPNREIWPADRGVGLAYRGIVRWGGTLSKAYYRYRITGAAFPDDAPVLLVQNHTNGIVDAYALLITTRRRIRILVKYKLMTTPLLGWMLRRMEAVPLYRRKDGVDTRKNAEAFAAINVALRERSVIALFPEGESLTSIGLRSLKSGVARMAISAEQSLEGGIGLKIVPLGTTWEDRDRIRTRMSAIIGEPIDVGAELAAIHTQDPRERVESLLKRVEESLQALILHADTDEEHRAAVALERIHASDDTPLGLRRKAALRALRSDRDRDHTGALERLRLVTDLGDALHKGRLSGDDLTDEAPSAGSILLSLAVLLPAAILGLPVLGLPSLAAVLISRMRRTPDKLVTLRLIPGSCVYLLWGALLTAVAASLSGPLLGALVLGLFILYVPLGPRILDGLFSVRRAVLRRALERRPSDLQALQQNILSIRRALPLEFQARSRAPKETHAERVSTSQER